MLDVLSRILERAGPIKTTVGATVAVVLGVLIVLYPVILAWIVGVTLVLAGLGVFGLMLGLLLRSAQPPPGPTDNHLTQHDHP
jgi:hypothetical protein